MFQLFYKKNNNTKLFKYLEENGLKTPQNYIPLFSKFFSLEEGIKDYINNTNPLPSQPLHSLYIFL